MLAIHTMIDTMVYDEINNLQIYIMLYYEKKKGAIKNSHIM